MESAVTVTAGISWSSWSLWNNTFSSTLTHRCAGTADLRWDGVQKWAFLEKNVYLFVPVCPDKALPPFSPLQTSITASGTKGTDLKCIFSVPPIMKAIFSSLVAHCSQSISRNRAQGGRWNFHQYEISFKRSAAPGRLQWGRLALLCTQLGTQRSKKAIDKNDMKLVKRPLFELWDVAFRWRNLQKLCIELSVGGRIDTDARGTISALPLPSMEVNSYDEFTPNAASSASG